MLVTFFDTLTSNSFFPQITFPTRFSGRCGTLIDNFFVKYSPIGAGNVSGILTHRLSDHQPYFLVIDPIPVKQVPPKMIDSRRLNTKNINDFADALSASNMYDQLNTDKECDPNENYNILNSIISNSINELND